MRTWEHRAVCVSKMHRDVHTVVLLPSAVSMDTHRCKSRETTKRENASAVCFMRGFVNKKCGCSQIVFDVGLWGLKTAESREIREPEGQVHLKLKLCYHLLRLMLFQIHMLMFFSQTKGEFLNSCHMTVLSDHILYVKINKRKRKLTTNGFPIMLNIIYYIHIYQTVLLVSLCLSWFVPDRL